MIHVPRESESFGRYVVGPALGSGGMGVVHVAHDTVLDRDVALKVVAPQLAADPDFRARFEREAALLARLDSPHIVQIYDHGEHDGCLFLATQLVAEGDLRGRIGTGMPPALALDIIDQVLDGLSDAHRVGVVHRDIKPGNILLRERDGQPWALLCDFGIATAPGHDLTRTGGVTGSLPYMPPERHRGESSGAPGDLYSAACLLWAMLTGAPPWSGTDVEVALAHMSADAPQLPGNSDFATALNPVLQRALAKRPEDRYRTAAQMRRALHAARSVAPVALTDQPETAVRRPVATPPTEGGRRRRAGYVPLAIACAVVLLLAAGGVSWGLSRRTTTTDSTATGADLASESTDSAAASASTPPDVPPRTRETARRTSRPSNAASAPAASVPAPSTAGAHATTKGPTSGGSRQSPPAGPTYDCWNGQHTSTLAACRWPEGLKGARWMFPNAPFGNCQSGVDIGYTDGDREAFRCTVSPGNTVTYVRWTSAAAADGRYSWTPERTWLTTPAGDVCGLRSYGRPNGVYSGEFVYLTGGKNHYWSAVINSSTFDGRSDLQHRLGATRACNAQQGTRSP